MCACTKKPPFLAIFNVYGSIQHTNVHISVRFFLSKCGLFLVVAIAYLHMFIKWFVLLFAALLFYFYGYRKPNPTKHDWHEWAKPFNAPNVCKLHRFTFFFYSNLSSFLLDWIAYASYFVKYMATSHIGRWHMVKKNLRSRDPVANWRSGCRNRTRAVYPRQHGTNWLATLTHSPVLGTPFLGTKIASTCL